MKIKKVHLLGLLISISISISLFIFFLQNTENKTYSQENTQININYPEKVYNILISGHITNEKNIGMSFCKNILKSVTNNKIPLIYMTENTKYIYSPFESIWFYIFCKKNLWENFNPFEKYFPQIIKNIGDNFLSYNPYLSTWIYQLSNDIFQPLINDYFNLKIANILGFSISKEKNIEELIKNFSNKYFGECKDNNNFFIWKEDIKISQKNVNQAICSHPETYNYLSNIFKEIKLGLNNLTILNINILKATLKQSQNICQNLLKNQQNNEKFLDQFRNCGFITFTTSNDNDLKIFQNIVLNEFLRYSLFLSYYKFIKLSNIDLQPITIGKDFNTSITKNNLQLIEIDQNIYQTLSSIEKSLSIIYNIASTFPIHIWNKIYYEDLKKYRKSILKIYTPIHQLYYKLQNVQDRRR